VPLGAQHAREWAEKGAEQAGFGDNGCANHRLQKAGCYNH
jgi:hypothetical protein